MNPSAEASQSTRDILGVDNKLVVDSKVCPTKLLEDIPAVDDALAFHAGIGPHKMVARAISDLILSPDEAGGKMIGLEGSWGSGKTTVINLLRNDLKDNEDVAVFTFDAWAHEGDPLRRTYLESLIQYFQTINGGWIDKADWDKILNNLANRRRTTNTRTVPKATLLGKLFAISALLLALGNPFLVASLRDGITISPNRPISWMFILGLFFTIMPFIVIAGNFIYIKVKQVRKKSNIGVTSNNSEDDEESTLNWAFLEGNAITEIKQDTTETPEPTSIEFENYFCKLMQAALLSDSKRKVVIVLDNLDRVEPKDALSIWATLQTFLQSHNARKEQWFTKVWIIVPYDPNGLRKLWMTRGAVNIPASEQNHGSNAKEIIPEDVVSESFIDKSFQLRFEVPPLVLSNWKAYLEKLVKEALPLHNDDCHTIYRVYNLCRTDKDNEPTPRELKLYVNQIGAIHRQWQDKFPLAHVAYYTILRRRHGNIIAGLRGGTLPRKKEIEAMLPSENLEANLAGLVFNVSANIGHQLLLAGPIKSALLESEGQELKTLEEKYGDGFWAPFEIFVTVDIADGEVIQIAEAAQSIYRSTLLRDNTKYEAMTVRDKLKDAAQKITNWAPFNSNVANGISALCQLISNQEFSKNIIINARNTVNKLSGDQLKSPLIEKIITGIVDICENLNQLGHQCALEEPFTIPLNANEWVEVCSHIKNSKEQYFPFIQPIATYDEISKTLCETVISGQCSNKILNTVAVTQKLQRTPNWDALSAATEQRLNTLSCNSAEALLLLKILFFLEKNEYANAHAALKRLSDNGQLMHYLDKAKTENDIQCEALCIVAFLNQRPNATKPNIVGNAEAGYNEFTRLLNADIAELAKQIVNQLQSQNNLSLLFKVVEEKTYPLLARCLRIVADDEKPEILYTPDEIVADWKYFRENLNEDAEPARFDKLLSHLCQETALIEKINENGFKIDDAQLYINIYKVFPSRSFGQWCKVSLEALDSNTWKSELDKNGDTVELLINLLDDGVSIGLKQEFQDALVEHAKGVLNKSASLSKEFVEKWPKVLDCLKTLGARKILRTRIIDAAMRQDGNCAEGFFEVYGDELTSGLILNKEKNMVARLFTPLVRTHNISGLRWLGKVFLKDPKILSKCGDASSIADFRERLQTEIEKPAKEKDELLAVIADIANKLGIKAIKKQYKDEVASDKDKPGNQDEKSNKNE